MNKTVKIIVWIVVLALVVWGLSAINKQAPDSPESGETIKIGAVLPMTGSAATYGEHQLNAIEMAVEEINADGGVEGRMFELVVEDDGTDPKKTVTAVQKLISTDKVEVMIGGVWDFLANAAISVVDSQKKVLISPAAAPDTLEMVSPYFFTTFPAIGLDQQIFEDYLRSQPVGQRIALVYINNAWGQVHRDTFKKALTAIDEHTLVKEIVLPKFEGNDIQRELSLLRPLGPSIIFAAINIGDSKTLVERNRSLGVNARIIAHPNLALNYFEGNLPAELMEDTVIYQLSQADDKFVSTYKEKYGKEPISEADSAYDAVYVIKQALRNNGGVYEAEAIRVGLKQIRNFAGVTGKIDYSVNNYPANKTPYLEVFKGGKFTKYGQ